MQWAAFPYHAAGKYHLTRLLLCTPSEHTCTLLTLQRCLAHTTQLNGYDCSILASPYIDHNELLVFFISPSTTTKLTLPSDFQAEADNPNSPILV